MIGGAFVGALLAAPGLSVRFSTDTNGYSVIPNEMRNLFSNDNFRSSEVLRSRNACAW